MRNENIVYTMSINFKNKLVPLAEPEVVVARLLLVQKKLVSG